MANPLNKAKYPLSNNELLSAQAVSDCKEIRKLIEKRTDDYTFTTNADDDGSRLLQEMVKDKAVLPRGIKNPMTVSTKHDPSDFDV